MNISAGEIRMLLLSSASHHRQQTVLPSIPEYQVLAANLTDKWMHKMMLLPLKSKAFLHCPVQKQVFKLHRKMKVAFITKYLKPLAEHGSLISSRQAVH